LAFNDPGAFLPVLAPVTTLALDPDIPDPTMPLATEAENDIALDSLEAFVAFESDVNREM